MGYIYSWEMPEVIEARRLLKELAVAQKMAYAHVAAMEIQHTAAISTREREKRHHIALEKKTGPQGSATSPTTDESPVRCGHVNSRPIGPADTSWNSNPGGKAHWTFCSNIGSAAETATGPRTATGKDGGTESGG